jgi:hypothetical protein
MSELTPCNYCSLNSIRRRAKESGLKVTLRHNRGGLDVYTHPPEIEIKEKVSDRTDEPNEYWRAWFMVLTDHCVC